MERIRQTGARLWDWLPTAESTPPSSNFCCLKWKKLRHYPDLFPDLWIAADVLYFLVIEEVKPSDSLSGAGSTTNGYQGLKLVMDVSLNPRSGSKGWITDVRIWSRKATKVRAERTESDPGCNREVPASAPEGPGLRDQVKGDSTTQSASAATKQTTEAVKAANGHPSLSTPGHFSPHQLDGTRSWKGPGGWGVCYQWQHNSLHHWPGDLEVCGLGRQLHDGWDGFSFFLEEGQKTKNKQTKKTTPEESENLELQQC